MQNGIASWDADETYPPGAVVLHEGKLWVSQRENHGVPPGTSQADWGGSSGIIVDDSGNDLMTLIEQLREKDTALDAKDADLQAQIDQLKNAGGGGGEVIAPDPGEQFADIGAWRIIVGTGGTTTGYLDTVTMPKPLGAVLAIGITEHNAVGWGPPGPNGEVTGTVTAFGTAPHPDADKFKLSVAGWDTVQNKWFYPNSLYPGGVSFQYIAIGENPDYVPPTPAP